MIPDNTTLIVIDPLAHFIDKETGMADETQRQETIRSYIDGWMEKLNARAQQYRAQGMTVEEALEAATIDIRLEIRRSPPVALD
jgi:hypothetical protein